MMRGLVGVLVVSVVVAGCGGGGGSSPAGSGAASAGGSAATLKIRDQAAALRTQASSAFAPARDGQGLAVANTVRTNGTGFAQVDYRDGSLTRLDANAQLTLTDLSTAQQAQRVVAKLDGGRAWSRVKKITSSQGRYEIDTAVASASVRGTTFTVDCTPPDGSCIFTVIDGVVTVTPHGGTPVDVHAGESVTVHKDGKLTHDPAQTPAQFAQVPWIAKNAAIDTSEPSPNVSSGSATAMGTGKSSFKAPKPGSDPCLLLIPAAARQSLGVSTVVKGPRPHTPSLPGVRTYRQCLYFVPGSASSPDVAINVDLKATTRAAYETRMAASIARRPAGAAECVTVPDLGDAANYCPGIYTDRFIQGSFVSVLVGQTRITGGANHYDAQARELPNKGESIALLRQVLTP